jgi:hypothetical protein
VRAEGELASALPAPAAEIRAVGMPAD